MPGRDAFRPAPPRADPRAAGISRRGLLGLDRTRFGRAGADHEMALRRVVAAWEEPGRIALLRAIEPVGELLADLGGVVAGDRVLDAGAGDGNVALACARRGARVEACDLVAAMVARGRRRTGPAVAWRQSDVQELPYADASFDVVLSAFGVPLAPRPRRALRQLVRVCRPGGRVLVAAWVPRGLPGRLPELVELAEPLPDGVPSPEDWGRAEIVRRRFCALMEDVEVRTRTVRLEMPSPDALYEALVPASADGPELRARFDRLLASCNPHPTRVEVDARYLVACGRLPPATV